MDWNYVDVQPDPTMETVMEVEVEEDCSRTVVSTPSIRPATGLDRIALFVNAWPAALPGRSVSKHTEHWCIFCG